MFPSFLIAAATSKTVRYKFVVKLHKPQKAFMAQAASVWVMLDEDKKVIHNYVFIQFITFISLHTAHVGL